MGFDVAGARGLVSHLRCREKKGIRVFDSAGLLNNCRLVNVEWKREQGPNPQKTLLPSYMLSESEEVEGLTGDPIGGSAGVTELTGTLTLEGHIAASPAHRERLSEVVCLAFRPKHASNELEDATENLSQTSEIEGYLDWCERGVRSLLIGSLSQDGSLSFSIGGTSCVSTSPDIRSTILGPPENMLWMQELKFEGSISQSRLVGDLTVSSQLAKPSPLKAGKIRIDKLCVPNECSYKVATSLWNRTMETLTVVPNTPEGTFVITTEVRALQHSVDSSRPLSPQVLERSGTANTVDLARSDSANHSFVLSESTKSTKDATYGLCMDDGCVWVEWRITTNSGNIAFGACTFDALTDEDSSIHVNEGTWCYQTSGEASHGYDMVETVVSQNTGDVIGIRMDMNKGVITFFVNDRQVLEFDNVQSNPYVHRLQTQSFELESKEDVDPPAH
jgi:hypothetical protein